MNQTLTALLIFVAMYVLLLIFSERRWIIALAAAVIFLLMGILPVYSAIRAINWNVLMMLAGTMMTVELFIQSKICFRMSSGRLVPGFTLRHSTQPAANIRRHHMTYTGRVVEMLAVV